MIIVVGGIKGGCGKTTIATNLTVLRATSGRRVLLVDTDDQQSATNWVEQRESGEHSKELVKFVAITLEGQWLYKQINKLKKNFDDIIIDVAGRDTRNQRAALYVANQFVVPFKPRSFEIWTITKVENMISEVRATNHKLKSMGIVNFADSTGVDNELAQEFIAQCPELHCPKILIGTRKAFGNAQSDGLGVIEMDVRNKQAIQEMKSLYREIWDEDI